LAAPQTLGDQVNPTVLLARGLQSAHRYRCRREAVMRPLLARYRYRTGFVLRRADKAASDINAFLIAATLGLGMLDLAYTVEKIVAALPPVNRTPRSHADRSSRSPARKVCMTDL
jgi:hypothetical protein